MMPRRVLKALLFSSITLGMGAFVASAEELNFSVMESGTYDTAAKEISQAFKAKTGVDVKVAAFPWAVLRQNNTTDLISGTGQYQVMSGGYYLADVYSNFSPLTDFIKKDDYAKGMLPGLMQPGRSEWNEGQQIGIPFGIDAYRLIVNTDILRAAGVTPNFKNWQEVASACPAIEQKNPGIACFSHATGNPEQIGAFFFSDYAGPYISKDGHYQLDAATATTAAAELPSLWKHLPKNGSALTFDEAHALFKNGKKPARPLNMPRSCC